MKRVVIALAVLLGLAALTGFDIVRSHMFRIELVSITPEVIPADGQTEVKAAVRLTDSRGNPVQGHYLFAVADGGGSLRANREATDQNGEAVFTYYPYQTTSILPVKDVVLEIVDESNSVFVEINTKSRVSVHLVEPTSSQESDVDMDAIFGE